MDSQLSLDYVDELSVIAIADPIHLLGRIVEALALFGASAVAMVMYVFCRWLETL